MAGAGWAGHGFAKLVLDVLELDDRVGDLLLLSLAHANQRTRDLAIFTLFYEGQTRLAGGLIRVSQAGRPRTTANACRRDVQTVGVLTAFGAVAVTFMMLMYALENRGPGFVAAFACGCALSSGYGFLAGTWPFGIVEAIWSLIALRRYVVLRHRS